MVSASPPSTSITLSAALTIRSRLSCGLGADRPRRGGVRQGGSGVPGVSLMRTAYLTRTLFSSKRCSSQEQGSLRRTMFSRYSDNCDRTTVRSSAMAGEANGLVEARGLRKTYKGGGSGKSQQVRALDGLSFSVPAGTVYALLGPNGAGKTTTVRILTTLSRPDEGSATVAGIDVLAQPGKVRSAIGAVSQHSGAIGLLTGQENLAMQGWMYGLGGRDLRRRVAELLDAFGLTEAANRQARTYSGG